MTYFTRILHEPNGAFISDKLAITAAVVSLGIASILTFVGESVPFKNTGFSQKSQIETAPQFETYVAAAQFASFIGVSNDHGGSIDMAGINAIITDQNKLDTQTLLALYAQEFSENPSTLAKKLSLSVSQTLLQERGYAFPWLAAPLSNNTPTALKAKDFSQTLGAGSQNEITAILRKFDHMHTLHLTHYFDTTVLSKTEYHVAVAILQERGAI